jgi:hypothetical protein
MPTYKLGPLESILRGKTGFPRMLLCERCGVNLGMVSSEAGPETFSDMPAAVVAWKWPRLKRDVELHEQL